LVGSLVYPTNLLDGTNPDTSIFFMRFQAKYITDKSILETLRKYNINTTFNDTLYNKISPNIVLPIPENISEALSHNWNLTKGLGAQLTNTAVDKLLGLAGGSLSNVVASARDTAQISIDPDFKYVYQGSNPRTFTYSITMVPRSRDEAKLAMAISKYFKIFSSPIKVGEVEFKPTTDAGFITKTADDILESFNLDLKAGAISNFLWEISFNNEELNNATKFNRRKFALTNVEINYTGSGNALFYEDGLPKQLTLSLTFNEMNTMYHSDWA